MRHRSFVGFPSEPSIKLWWNLQRRSTFPSISRHPLFFVLPPSTTTSLVSKWSSWCMLSTLYDIRSTAAFIVKRFVDHFLNIFNWHPDALGSHAVRSFSYFGQRGNHLCVAGTLDTHQPYTFPDCVDLDVGVYLNHPFYCWSMGMVYSDWNGALRSFYFWWIATLFPPWLCTLRVLSICAPFSQKSLSTDRLIGIGKGFHA